MGGKRSPVSTLVAVLVAAICMVGLAACGDGDNGEEARSELPGELKATPNARFDPDEVTVRFDRETLFTFENADDKRAHNFTLSYVFTDADNFVSVDAAPGEVKEVKFTVRERPAAGFLTYYCRFHQGEGMAGRIRLV